MKSVAAAAAAFLAIARAQEGNTFNTQKGNFKDVPTYHPHTYDVSESPDAAWQSGAGSAWGSAGWQSGAGSAWGSAGWQSGAGSAWGSAGWQSGAGSAVGSAGWQSGAGSAWGSAGWLSGAGSAWGSAGWGSAGSGSGMYADATDNMMDATDPTMEASTAAGFSKPHGFRKKKDDSAKTDEAQAEETSKKADHGFMSGGLAKAHFEAEMKAYIANKKAEGQDKPAAPKAPEFLGLSLLGLLLTIVFTLVAVGLVVFAGIRFGKSGSCCAKKSNGAADPAAKPAGDMMPREIDVEIR